MVSKFQRELTQELMVELFDYKDGHLYWKTNPRTGRKIAGNKAGSVNSNGYIKIEIDDKKYPEQTLVFLFHTGKMPKMVDHINLDRTDNRIENLRECTHVENMRNKKPFNKNGLPKNVYARKNKWCVAIGLNGKMKHFGTYADLELAELVAMEARNKYHGAFANHLGA